VRRRRLVDYGAVPERLLRFVAAEWPGMTPRDAIDVWHQERRAIALANPRTAIGNVVDELRGTLAERRRVWSSLYGEPHHSERR
jgi:hypothetical protein